MHSESSAFLDTFGQMFNTSINTWYAISVLGDDQALLNRC